MNVPGMNSIVKFYSGADIFITGGTGFLGKVLIEKLLRSCPDIGTMYLLMRPKRGQKGQDRINKLTNDMYFDTLKSMNPSSLQKLQFIEGDASEINLGISEANIEKLKSCSVIFHVAACVRFDDPLKSAILLNTRGTREVCELASKISGLKAMVHVSTAYIQPKNTFVQEKLYPMNCDWRLYIKYAETYSMEMLNWLTPKLTDFAPNTYTFTKNMAEQVCADYKASHNLPVIIYRPSIVSNTELEPFPGWNDNFNGPMGLLITSICGLKRATIGNLKNVLNGIPADICIKGMVIAAWKQWREQLNKITPNEIPIYNSASVKMVSFDVLVRSTDSLFEETPVKQAIGLPTHVFTECKFYGYTVIFFLQILPAIIIDGILKLLGKKPMLLKLQRLLFNAEEAISHFKVRTFTIENFNFINLQRELIGYDKEHFFIEERVHSHYEYIRDGYRVGIRVLLKETTEDTEIARKRYPYLKFIGMTIKLFTFYIALKFVTRFIHNC